MWWPGRKEETQPKTEVEEKYSRSIFERAGLRMWNAFNNLRNSSTRCEMGASLIAMNPPVAANIGVDNETCVNGTNDIAEHAVQRSNTVLRTTGGAPILGGTKTKLHQKSVSKKPWPLVRNGDLWMKMEEAVIAKNPKTVKLTKQKGHATEKMVSEGKVREVDREGNHQSDRAAELGITEEQKEVDHLGWKYAARQKAYGRLMARVHEFIIKVRKGQKEKKEEKEKLKNPFGTKDKNKMNVPKSLSYGTEAEGARDLEIRKTQQHDEEVEEERPKLEQVRCFLTNVKWKVVNEDDDTEHPGITWLELYVLFAIHGGCERIREKQKTQPHLKAETLQSAMAGFKRRVRKITKQCTKEEDEVYTSVSYARINRLQGLAISNKHAAINGTPIVDEEDARIIVKAILAMRGVNQKKHKILHEEGHLKLIPRPMAYKGAAHAWLRNLGKTEKHEDWTKEPRSPDPMAREKEVLSEIRCPECDASQCTNDQKLHTKVGYSQIKCKECHEVNTSMKWQCTCGGSWIKCGVHVRRNLMKEFPFASSTPMICRMPSRGVACNRSMG